MNVLSTGSRFQGIGKKVYVGFSLAILVAVVSLILISFYWANPPLFHLSVLVVVPGLILTFGGAIAYKIYEPQTEVRLVDHIVETAIVNLMMTALTWGAFLIVLPLFTNRSYDFLSYFSSLTRNASLAFWVGNSFWAFVTIGRRENTVLLALRGLPFVIFVFLILLWLKSLGL